MTINPTERRTAAERRRPTIRLAVLAVAAAIGVQLILEPSESSSEAMVIWRGEMQVVSRCATVNRADGPLVLEAETGRLSPLRLPPGVGMDYAALSPLEGVERLQVVGFGWSRAGDVSEGALSDFELVRMSLPDGEVLGRLPLRDEALPMGPPCFIPGEPAGVIYAGGDGRIYRVVLAPTFGDEVPGDRLRRLAWPESMPEADDARVFDLAWPAGGWLGGRALATVAIAGGDPQIWWLELAPGATSIVAAGRLLEEATEGEAMKVRLPNAARHADGTPVLAYLARPRERNAYQLRVAPVRIDPQSGVPLARAEDSRALAQDCLPTLPAVSRSGGMITVVQPRDRGLMTRCVWLDAWQKSGAEQAGGRPMIEERNR